MPLIGIVFFIFKGVFYWLLFLLLVAVIFVIIVIIILSIIIIIKTNVLTTQRLIIKSIWEHGMKSASEIWSKSVSKLPKNIYNFFICYVSNSLANVTNIHKWGKTASPLCLHCNKNQTLGHVVAGCEHRWEKNIIIIVMILFYWTCTWIY